MDTSATRIKLAVAAGVCALLWGGMAAAQSCASLPYALTNGTTADATQVMANFNCAALVGKGIFNGNVGIGTTTPADNLDVYGQAVIGANAERLSLNSGAIGFNRRVSTGQIYNTSAYAYQWRHNANSTAGSDFLTLEVYSPTGSMVSGGAIAITGGAAVSIGGGPQPGWLFTSNGQAGGTAGWATFSDARLKSNVVPLSGALATVLQLQGVRYNWAAPADRTAGRELNLPDAPQVGFLAQDLAKVVPEAVLAPADPKTGVYGVIETKLIPLLVEAIKAQQAEIAALQAQVAALRPVH